MRTLNSQRSLTLDNPLRECILLLFTKHTIPLDGFSLEILEARLKNLFKLAIQSGLVDKPRELTPNNSNTLNKPREYSLMHFIDFVWF